MGGTSKFFLALLGLLVAIYGSYAGYRYLANRQPAGTIQTAPVGWTPQQVDFTLLDQQGKAFDTQVLRGKVWVASFFFTGCAHMCLQLNQGIDGLLTELDNPDLASVSITCDPENDTPIALAGYAEHNKFDRYGPHWKFLTGDMDEIARIGREQFQSSVARGVHSQRVIVVDRQGKTRGSYLMLDEFDRPRLVNLIEKLLAEPAPQPQQVDQSPEADSQLAGSSS